MRLLLIEDDKKIALFVKTGLEEAGFIVDMIPALSMTTSPSTVCRIVSMFLLPEDVELVAITPESPAVDRQPRAAQRSARAGAATRTSRFR